MEAFLCGRNSSSFPVSHISTPCSLGCIIHHISPLFISLSITFCHLLEPHKVSIIIIIVIIIVIIIIKHTSIFGCEDWGPYGLLLPHLLPSLWVFLRCLCGMPGFISELWHLNQDSDLGPNSTSGVPQGTTSAVSTTAEEAAEICKDILRISKTFWENRGNSVTENLHWYWVSWLELRSGVPVAQAIFWPRLDVHGLSGRQSHLPWLAYHRPGTDWTRLEVSQIEV